MTRATTLYPFVPSGPRFATALEFFAELGFTSSIPDSLTSSSPGWHVRQARSLTF